MLQTAEINLLNLIFSSDSEETDCEWNGLMGALLDAPFLLMSSETLKTSQWMAEFHFPWPDSDFWICDWLFTKNKFILNLIVYTRLQTLPLFTKISQHKNNYFGFVFPIQSLRNGTKESNEYTCLLTS